MFQTVLYDIGRCIEELNICLKSKCVSLGMNAHAAGTNVCNRGNMIAPVIT